MRHACGKIENAGAENCAVIANVRRLRTTETNTGSPIVR